MIDSYWSTRLLHLFWGIAVYAVFQAWGILSETSAPDSPARRDPGANGFVLGQAVAMVGLIGLSLLCGRVLFSTLQRFEIEVFALWAAGILALAEGVAAMLSLPLVGRRESIEVVDFEAGKNLVLRHSPSLFLGLVAVGSWLGPATSTMIAIGSLIGWSIGQMLSGPRPAPGFPEKARWTAAVLGLAMAVVLLRAAIKWTF